MASLTRCIWVWVNSRSWWWTGRPGVLQFKVLQSWTRLIDWSELKMSTFTFDISFLTTSNLPWFMDLTLQVPMQYCSLQHWTLLLSPVTSTSECCFCFGSVSSFFLELFLHWSLVAYWHLLTWGVHLSVSYLFSFSYCSWGSQDKNTEVVGHSLFQYMYQKRPPSWGGGTQFFWERREKQNYPWFTDIVLTGPEGWYQKSFHHSQNLPCSSYEACKY